MREMIGNKSRCTLVIVTACYLLLIQQLSSILLLMTVKTSSIENEMFFVFMIYFNLNRVKALGLYTKRFALTLNQASSSQSFVKSGL